MQLCAQLNVVKTYYGLSKSFKIYRGNDSYPCFLVKTPQHTHSTHKRKKLSFQRIPNQQIISPS